MRPLRCGGLLAVIAGLTAGPSAQGLADAARRASAAPQQPATKKYTNDDVETATPVPPPAAAAAQSEAATEAPKGETKAVGAPSSAEQVTSTDPEREKKVPEDVVNRIATLKAQLANKEKQVRDLQARGIANDAARVTKQISSIQIELKVLEGRLSSQD